jgi:hypothetical protein
MNFCPRTLWTLFIALFSFLFLACGDWKVDSAQLTSRTSVSAQTASCSNCHRYPLLDTNHTYHLFHTSPNKRFNGPITCLDCHSRSIQFVDVALADSFFTDPSGALQGQFSSLDFPTSDLEDSLAIIIRTWHLDSIVVRKQHRPIPASKHLGKVTEVTEYITGLAHLNDSVDIVFDPKVSDTARFHEPAHFNPKQETCSAVACHPGDKLYRFGAPSRGITELKE